MNLRNATLISNKNLTNDVFELTFKTKNQFKFKAGQFITIKINDKRKEPCFRAYSIASSPKKNYENFTLVIKQIPAGRGSSWLKSLVKNDQIEFLGPSGEFTFKTHSLKKALFIATGTGIAPFKAIIEEELNKGNKQPIHLIWGLRRIKDIFYKKFFEELAQKHKNFKFNITLSQPENDWQEYTGRITKILENFFSPFSDGRACPSLDSEKKSTEIYICGLKEMVEDVWKILKEKGIKKKAIYTERF